jgi:hypothetical protein
MEVYSKKTKKYAIQSLESTRDSYGVDGVSHLVYPKYSSSTFAGECTADGFENPSWKTQVRLGLNATTYFSGVNIDLDTEVFASLLRDWTTIDPYGNLFIHAREETWGLWGHNYLKTFPSPNSNDVTEVNNNAIRKFLSKAKAAQSSFEAGQDFGEYKETIESIHKPFNSLKTGILAYLETLKKRSHKFRLAPKGLHKMIADTYLEYHFGWAPLAEDIGDAISKLGSHRFPESVIQGQGGKDFAGYVVTNSFSAIYVSGICQYDMKSTSSYQIRLKGAVRTRSDISGKVGLAQDLQLTPENWLPTAWDLLPFSWMADYFTNVGDILQGASFMSSDLIWGCKTVRNQTVEDYGPFRLVPLAQSHPDGWSSVFSDVASGGSTRTTGHTVIRTPIDASDLIPTFRFRIPTKTSQYLNMGALLLQRAIPVSSLLVKILKKVL